jgi:hypothetical protein
MTIIPIIDKEGNRQEIYTRHRNISACARAPESHSVLVRIDGQTHVAPVPNWILTPTQWDMGQRAYIHFLMTGEHPT